MSPLPCRLEYSTTEVQFHLMSRVSSNVRKQQAPLPLTPSYLLTLKLSQAYPFVVRKVLRSDNTTAALLLRDMVYDVEGGGSSTTLCQQTFGLCLYMRETSALIAR